MPPQVYTINPGDITPANSYASVNLLGCKITLNAAGTAYQFVSQPQYGSQILATAGPPLPSVPFSFPMFAWQGVYWTVTVTSLGPGQVSGTWSTPGVPMQKPDDTVNPQNGDFTAQTGGTILPEEAANAAGHGNN